MTKFHDRRDGSTKYYTIESDTSKKSVNYDLGICKTCGGRTQMIGTSNGKFGPHIHARYPMDHPADPKPANK